MQKENVKISCSLIAEIGNYLFLNARPEALQ
jgi:hypothetical protein